MKKCAWIGVVACLQFACTKSPYSYVERGNGFAATGKYADAEIEYRRSIQKDPKFAEGYYRLGIVERAMKHGDQALDDLQRAVDFDPGNQTYAIELANVSLEAYQVVPGRRSLYDEVAKEAQTLLRANPNSFDGLRLQGDILVIDRKYDDALADLQKANTIKPNDPDVVFATVQVLFTVNRDREGEQLAQQFLEVRNDFEPMYDVLEAHYVRKHQPGDAEHVLESEIAALPKNPHPRLQLAGFYRSAGRDQEMTQVLQKMLADHTTFPSAPALVGDFYAETQSWNDALAQYRSGVQQSSGSNKLEYQKRIEHALEMLGQRDEALNELNEILKTVPKDPDMLLSRAVLLRGSKDPKDRALSVEQLKALAATYPTRAVVRYQLGLAYLATGDSRSAWNELQKSANLAKQSVAPRLVLAGLALNRRDYSAARDTTEQVLALDPNNQQAKLLHAAALVGSKSYQQAETELKPLSQAQPDSKEIGLQLAALAAGEKDYRKAEALYRRFYQPGSADLRPLQGLLELFLVEHHPEKAQALLEDELKQQPDSRPVRLLLASVATQQRNFDLASQQYHWLQSNDPKSELAYADLGYLYELQGANQDALASYEKARNLAPNDPKILGAIAALETNSGHSQEAIATLNKQLALAPNDATAMNNLAYNLAEEGTNLDRATALAEAASRKYPNEPGVIDTLGWVYTKRGLNQSAIQVLSTLVKKYPNRATYRYHLGVALLQDKQPSRAKQEFLAALSAHPAKELSGRIQDDLSRLR